MKSRSVRHGLTALECLVAIAIISVMISTLLMIQLMNKAQTRAAKSRLVAEQTLANMAENFIATPTEEITDDLTNQWIEQARQRIDLGPSTIQITTEAISEPAVGKKFDLKWISRPPKTMQVQLTVWKFDDQSTETGVMP